MTDIWTVASDTFISPPRITHRAWTKEDKYRSFCDSSPNLCQEEIKWYSLEQEALLDKIHHKSHVDSSCVYWVCMFHVCWLFTGYSAASSSPTLAPARPVIGPRLVTWPRARLWLANQPPSSYFILIGVPPPKEQLGQKPRPEFLQQQQQRLFHQTVFCHAHAEQRLGSDFSNASTINFTPHPKETNEEWSFGKHKMFVGCWRWYCREFEFEL